MKSKYVVIIQCDIAHNRCSGFACTDSFYEKTGKFEGYPQDTQYLSFTCGGCCGKSVSTKLEHLGKKLIKKATLLKDDVVVHLASCMTTDNFHYDRCPHIDYIKSIVIKKGFHHIIEGSYVSRVAEKKRDKGIYCSYK